MTPQTIEVLGRVIALGIMLLVNIIVGYLIGHQFHSFIIGYVTYAVLISLDSVSLKLAEIRNSLKGAH